MRYGKYRYITFARYMINLWLFPLGEVLFTAWGLKESNTKILYCTHKSCSVLVALLMGLRIKLIVSLPLRGDHNVFFFFYEYVWLKATFLGLMGVVGLKELSSQNKSSMSHSRYHISTLSPLWHLKIFRFLLKLYIE